MRCLVLLAGLLVLCPLCADAATPCLAFTDLAQGPRSGHVDTSRGQTANVNGTIVTVWGYNLGSSQGASTLTVGGVAARAIYYWGNATAPNCGASTLYNSYQKLQCVIFQIAGTTPTGAQNIVATVNGVATAGLSFNVMTTGNIYFAPRARRVTALSPRSTATRKRCWTRWTGLTSAISVPLRLGMPALPSGWRCYLSFLMDN